MAKLYIVPTPIGNLDDITIRAVRVLSEVDFILAEDTRTSSVLLKHLGIEKKMYAHHKFNEHATVGLVADNIAQGRSAALISDAGTPGISDPGFLLVRACLEAGIEVETLPGATAFVPALVQSGFPCDRFCFEGFLPQKKGRNKHLQSLASEPRTMIFYESPFRVRTDRAGNPCRGCGLFPGTYAQRRVRDRGGGASETGKEYGYRIRRRVNE